MQRRKRIHVHRLIETILDGKEHTVIELASLANVSVTVHGKWLIC